MQGLPSKHAINSKNASQKKNKNKSFSVNFLVLGRNQALMIKPEVVRKHETQTCDP